MRGGVRLRLAVRAALLAGLALAGVAAIVESAVVRPMERREDDRLRTLADGLAALAAKEGAAGFRRSAEDWVRAPRGEWTALVAEDGTVAAAAGRAFPVEAIDASGQQPSTVAGVAPAGDRVVSRTAPSAGSPAGRVVVGFSLEEVRSDQARLRILVALTAAAGIVLVGVGAWSGAGAVLGPLGAMTSAAKSASADPASLRLPDAGHGGEFEELAGLLNDLLGRIGAALEDERRFASDAAHELRGPLSVLRLRAEKALAAADDAEMRRALEAAIEDCERVGRLVDALLELSRVSAVGATVPPREPVDAAGAVRALAPDLEALASARGIRFELAPDEGPLPAVAAPREVVETCLSVLVDNASRYAPKGGRVRVGMAAGPGGALRLVVSDDGPGVPAEEGERVFERLFRGKAVRAAGPRGFGLGLSLARRLARSAGGDVALENPGQPGARFAVLFPPPGATGRS
jgi:two-component system OmpR family sensor kinase